jgi:hypothetical protein
MAVQARIDVSHGAGLESRLMPLRDEAIASWRATAADLPSFGPITTWRTRWANARATRRLIDDVAARVETYPADEASRVAWRDSLRAALQAFGETRFGWPGGYRRLLFGDAFYESAVDFARRARAFDPSLSLDDLWQALRNVWIGNSLQMLLCRPVTLTQGLFAYSMLYPVTDNLLDAPGLSATDKRVFNERFGRRLLGERLSPRTESETRAFTLVGQIEEDFPREGYPDVWASVLAIHRGQIASLRQQRPQVLSEATLLDISVTKGGASVLADLYLVAGDANPAEERFAFGYGVFLQLLDDLQDVQTDLETRHQTLVTVAARRGSLDAITSQLGRYMDAVLDGTPSFGSRERADSIDLIRRNCRSLLVGVMAELPARFTRGFRRSVETRWPIRFAAMRRLRRHAQRRFTATAEHVRSRHDGKSPLELMLDASA